MPRALARSEPIAEASNGDELERSRAGDGPPLRYRWHEGLASLRSRSYAALTFDRVEQAIAIGDQFIEHFAAQAEAFGCQPVHLLKPPISGETRGGGLAWRWTEGMRPIGFGPRVLVASFAERSFAPAFVYRLEVSGEVTLLYGKERDEALASVQQSGTRS